MNYYSHHIGDFNNATRHLTRTERAIYRDAIELYYDTESELTGDIEKLARRLLVISQDEKDALNVVLDEFFTLTETGYFHERCDKEIKKYQSFGEAGKRGAAKRWQKGTDGVVNDNDIAIDRGAIKTPLATNNHKPLTNNHKIKNITPIAMLMAMNIPESLANDWIAVRKLKKSATTQTALDAIKKTAESAGYTFLQAVQICCERGWVGFKSEWLIDTQTREQGTTTAALTIFKPQYIAEQTGSYFTEIKNAQLN